MRKTVFVVMIAAMAVMAFAGVIAAQEEEVTVEATTWLGVRIVEDGEQVIIAAVVPGSPASAADLLIGDVVQSFNGEAISSASQLTELVQAAAPGDAATLEVLRGEESVSIDVELAASPASIRSGRVQAAFDPVTFAEHLLNADIEAAEGGYEVVDTLSINNPFAVEEGDLLTAINGITIDDLTLPALVETMAEAESFSVQISVTRGGEDLTLESEQVMMGRRGMDFFFHGMPGGRFEFGPGSQFEFRGEGMNPHQGRMPGMRGQRGGFGSPFSGPDTDGGVTVPDASQTNAPIILDTNRA